MCALDDCRVVAIEKTMLFDVVYCERYQLVRLEDVYLLKATRFSVEAFSKETCLNEV